MVTNKDINDRRRARLRAAGGATEPGPDGTPVPVAGLGDYSDAWLRTTVPTRDLAPGANFFKRTFEIVREAFGPEGPAIAVETGSRRGAFAFGLANATKRTQIFSIDPWVGRMGHGCLHVYLKRVPDLFTRCHPLPGTSVNWARCFPFKVDLLVLSGAPKWIYAKALETEINLWRPCLNPGALVMIQDVKDQEMAAVAEAAFPDVEAGFPSNNEKLGPGDALTCWGRV